MTVMTTRRCHPGDDLARRRTPPGADPRLQQSGVLAPVLPPLGLPFCRQSPLSGSKFFSGEVQRGVFDDG